MSTQKSFEDLVEIMATLRSPSGCPWDREQTPQSILPHLIEEAYEVAEAIQGNDTKEVIDELGDLLLQVVFHAQFLKEAGNGTIDDVIGAISEKLIRRHPHVFGDQKITNSEEVLKNWEAIKLSEKKEKANQSVLAGVPQSLPALLKARRITEKASRVGFDWQEIGGVLDKVIEEVNELKAAIVTKDKKEISHELGDILFSLANLGRHLDTDPELALQQTNERFKHRFEWMELKIREENRDIHTIDSATWESFWQQAKMATESK